MTAIPGLFSASASSTLTPSFTTISVGASPAATGDIRLRQAGTINQLDTTDKTVFLGAAGAQTFGALDSALVTYQGQATHVRNADDTNYLHLYNASTQRAVIRTGIFVLTDGDEVGGGQRAVYFALARTGVSTMAFSATVTTPSIVHDQNGTTTGVAFAITAQVGASAFASGDLQIGGGAAAGGGGASAAGFVDFRNQAVATSATAYAGGAAIPATCGYLPVKIAGTIRKLVVVQT